MSLFRKPTSDQRDDITVAVEVEAFLQGRLFQLYRDHAIPAAPWLRLNAIAHGTMDDLEDLASARVSHAGHPSETAWWKVTGFIAADVLERVDSEAALRALQQRALWRLERDLLENGSDLVTKPFDLLRLVRCELDELSAPPRDRDVHPESS